MFNRTERPNSTNNCP